MVYDWEAHRETCYRLYIVEGRTLDEIISDLKRVHNFTPSKRAFQTQFRKWKFPAKQNPAQKDERLRTRVEELWGQNFSSKQMAATLAEEGFQISSRELSRLRTRNGWLLREPNGNGARTFESASEPATERSSSMERASSQQTQSTTGANDDGALTIQINSGKKRRRRNRVAEDGSGEVIRFPSEMTIDQARTHLGLDQATYKAVRKTFQELCTTNDVRKKTEAGPEKWEAIKTALISKFAQLQVAVMPRNENAEPAARAIDVICTDVTKRMRTHNTRMTLADAKNELGLNPQEVRDVRMAFDTVVQDSKYLRKSDINPSQWEELKQKWAAGSSLVKDILADKQDGPSAGQMTTRALEVLATDVMKRHRDKRTQRNPSQGHKTVASLTPESSSTGGSSENAARDPDQTPPAVDQMEVDNGQESMGFNNMAEVSHASPIAYTAPDDTLATQMSIPVQLQPSNLQGHTQGLSQSHQVLSHTISSGMQMHSQLATPMILGSNTQQTGYINQQYVQHQYQAAPASAPPMYTPVQSAPSSYAVYIRLSPASNFTAHPSLWVAALTTPSVAEIRGSAMRRFPGAVWVRTDAMFKDTAGREMPLLINTDQELEAYLNFSQSETATVPPTFSVHLWRT